MSNATIVNNHCMHKVTIPVGMRVDADKAVQQTGMRMDTPLTITLEAGIKRAGIITPSVTQVPAPAWAEAKKHHLVRAMLQDGRLVEAKSMPAGRG